MNQVSAILSICLFILKISLLPRSEIAEFVLFTSFLVGVLFGITFECYKFAHKVVVNVHHSSVVVEITAVVFGAENCDQLFVFSEESVTILHDLVTSTNEVKVVFLKEDFELFFAEDKSAAPLILLPVSGVLIRVVPEEICYKPTVRDISWFVYVLDLFE